MQHTKINIRVQSCLRAQYDHLICGSQEPRITRSFAPHDKYNAIKMAVPNLSREMSFPFLDIFMLLDELNGLIKRS